MKNNKHVKNMALCALFAAITAVCAWISIPTGPLVFTMQTFAVFLTLGLLGGRLGTVSLLVYLLLGCVGLPVFSGFRGGFGMLMGATGGYLWGFLAAGLVYRTVTALLGSRPWVTLLAMALGQTACYAFGSLWFLLVYLGGGNAISLGAVLAQCVLPFLLPDCGKLALAFFLTGKLGRFVR